MPFYRYRTKDRDGRVEDGAAEAQGAGALAASLRAAGLVVLSVERTTARAARDAGLPPRWHPSWLRPATVFDVELAFRQMASMLRGGLTILGALKTAGEQARGPRAARLWRGVAADVGRGGSFSGALAAAGGPVPSHAVRLAAVGEQSGEMDAALERAADHLAGLRELRLAVAGALAYPVFACVAAVAVAAFLVVSVLPKLEAFLAGGGARLPPVTRALLDFSAWLRANGAFALAAFAAAAALLAVARRTARGREATDAAALRLPAAGGMLRLAGTAVYARGMSVLLESDVPLLDAMRHSAALLSNRSLARRAEEARRTVMRGGTLGDALSRVRAFDPMLSRMAAVAETTGTLGRTLGEVADFEEKRLTVAVKRFSAFLEPLVIAFAAGLVGFVYIAFFTALFAMADMG